MTNIDIVELLKTTLRNNGCDEQLLGDFDGNSTITLEFEDSPSLLISEYEGRIILWAQLMPFDKYTVLQQSRGLMELLFEQVPHAVTDHLLLSESEDMLILQCYMKKSSLNSDDFPHALETFYTSIVRYVEALR